jgi:hypothetical protein
MIIFFTKLKQNFLTLKNHTIYINHLLGRLQNSYQLSHIIS